MPSIDLGPGPDSGTAASSDGLTEIIKETVDPSEPVEEVVARSMVPVMWLDPPGQCFKTVQCTDKEVNSPDSDQVLTAVPPHSDDRSMPS